MSHVSNFDLAKLIPAIIIPKWYYNILVLIEMESVKELLKQLIIHLAVTSPCLTINKSIIAKIL